MHLFLMSLGLVFVFEGLLPFLLPKLWRSMMQRMLMQDDKALRIFGLLCMFVGVGILYFVR